MKKALMLISIAAITFSGSVSAKPLDLSKVSDDANWLMHVDFDSARNSTIGSFIMDKINDNDEAADRMEEMKEAFGVDMEGFANLTMFGNGEREKGIAIMVGGMDVEKLVGFAQLNENLTTTQKGKHEIYSVGEGRRSMAFTTMKGNVIVGGPDEDYVSQGIRLAKGKGNGRAPIGLLNELRRIIPNPGMIGYVDVEKAAAFHDLDERGQEFVEKANSAGMIVGEVDGEIRMAAILKTNDEETARQLEEMANGLMAMAALSKESNRHLGKVLESHSVKRAGNAIILQVGLSIDAIKEGIEKEMDKNI
ncbi:MAG: hypothetical protein CMI31_15025 [Opitutae bacterium]|nr:hypothetical protein [Opitutae bacterium]|tara:strand:- start:180 stop:1100 length:921 start_codon:yes stop_codon:yes gene_type:complete